MEGEFLLELSGTWQGALPFGHLCQGSHEHLSLEHIHKKAQMCLSMHGVHRDREGTVTLPSTYVVMVLTHQAPQ